MNLKVFTKLLNLNIEFDDFNFTQKTDETDYFEKNHTTIILP